MRYTHSVTVTVKFTYPIIDEGLDLVKIEEGIRKYSLATEDDILALAKGGNVEVLEVQAAELEGRV